MQSYPCGGQKEHYYKVVEEDKKFKDDYSGHGGKHTDASKESHSVGVTLGVGLLKGLLTHWRPPPLLL
ncbi:hypothetical protein Pfo_022281 [Paulownia fortunei]|nr:hypothetical protein Pfo_022281 [Paulownia fortunei]